MSPAGLPGNFSHCASVKLARYAGSSQAAAIYVSLNFPSDLDAKPKPMRADILVKKSRRLDMI